MKGGRNLDADRWSVGSYWRGFVEGVICVSWEHGGGVLKEEKRRNGESRGEKPVTWKAHTVRFKREGRKIESNKSVFEKRRKRGEAGGENWSTTRKTHCAW